MMMYLLFGGGDRIFTAGSSHPESGFEFLSTALLSVVHWSFLVGLFVLVFGVFLLGILQ